MIVNEINELHTSGLGGTLKVVAVLAVFALASMGALVVLDAIPVATFTNLSIKLAALSGIAGLTAVVVWALMRSGRRG